MKNPNRGHFAILFRSLEQGGTGRSVWSCVVAEQDGDSHLNPEKMPLESAVQAAESSSRAFSVEELKILLRRCTKARSAELGERLHSEIVRRGLFQNRFLCNLLINLYAKCGCLDKASSVFESIRGRNIFSWNMMLAALGENGSFDDTCLFFRRMQMEGMTPNEFGVSSFLSACTDHAAVEHGRYLQLLIAGTENESDPIVQTALVSMFGKLGYPKEAESVFLKMNHRDVVAWSAMIAAYARNGYPWEALDLFQRMDLEGVPPNQVTFVSGLDACANLAAFKTGILMHQRVLAAGLLTDVVVGTALVNLYGKCGQLEIATEVFDQMCEKNVVTWSALSAAFAQNGHCKEAIWVFHRMDLEGVPPNPATFVTLLDACAGLAALKQGRKAHERIQQLGSRFESDVFILTGLVNMYSKCGNLDLAGDLFERTTQLDLVLWNSLIATNAQHGQSTRALHFFERMQLEGLNPTVMTFTSVLSACSHGGMLNQGRDLFLSFIRDHGVPAEGEHFGGMVDLLGRAGFLQDAQELLIAMPFEPSEVAWTTFLASCRTYRDMNKAKWAAEHLFRLDPRKRAPYVLLSNMYAKAGRWADVAKMRRAMQESMAVKEFGRSWIEVRDRVHEFVSGDIDHPRIREIHQELERLNRLIKEAGYVPDTDMVLHDVGAEVKETMVGYHSEKLAMAFALIAMPDETGPIRVVKNLRVCNDCHTASKFISKVTRREIVVRDSHRFHRFQDGVCSCGDYW